MDAKDNKPTTVDAYVAQFPQEVQQILNRLRAVVKEAAPQAEEKISYQMAGYYLNGGLVWFGAYKRHIGFYPTTAAMEVYAAELDPYRAAKSALNFPLDETIPYDLIGRLVKARVAEVTQP